MYTICCVGYMTPGQTPMRDQLSINPEENFPDFRSVYIPLVYTYIHIYMYLYR